MKHTARSIIHVLIQFSCIIFLLAISEYRLSILSKTVMLAGFSLAIWAVLVMSKSKLPAFPEPDNSATLVKKGPYKLIRHPMYASLLLFFAPLVVELNEIANYIAFGIFSLNQILKMLYEEKLLKKKFSGYNKYMEESWRMVPFIY